MKSKIIALLFIFVFVDTSFSQKMKILTNTGEKYSWYELVEYSQNEVFHFITKKGDTLSLSKNSINDIVLVSKYQKWSAGCFLGLTIWIDVGLSTEYGAGRATIPGLLIGASISGILYYIMPSKHYNIKNMSQDEITKFVNTYAK